MAYTLPELPYDYNALEPHIDEETMRIHHDKHHNAYVTNLNAAVENYPELATKSVDELVADLDAVPEAIRTAVRNNGGGHANHTFFWEVMGPNAGGAPTGPIAAAIDEAFGSFEAFQAEFNKAAATRFGSGWAWLIDKEGKLEVVISANQDLPEGDCSLLLPLDMWEHAFYLKYKNKKKDYAEAFFKIVNWRKVAERLK